MARDCLVRFARVTKRASLDRALLALRRDELAELLLPPDGLVIGDGTKGQTRTK